MRLIFHLENIWAQGWLRGIPGKRRTQGTDFMQKMSLMCTQVSRFQSTSFIPQTAIGHHQGIQEVISKS